MMADNAQHFFEAARRSPFDALARLRQGDIDGARAALQKIAYVVHSEQPELKPRLTALMNLFVAVDPLFQRALATALPLIRAQPGIEQIKLYRPLGLDAEMGRYVFYFAESTQRVRRVKSGRSYELYPGPLGLDGQPPRLSILDDQVRAQAHVRAVPAAALPAQPPPTPEPISFDVPDFPEAARRGFFWVARDLQLPPGGAVAALEAAFIEHQNHEFRALVRALQRAWPADARWPDGESWLRVRAQATESERALFDDYTDGGLMGLLAHRLMHVAHRVRRDAQVRATIDPRSPARSKSYTHVVINRNHWHDGDRNACGIRKESLLSIEGGLRFLQTPAHQHPACDCTADPHPVGEGGAGGQVIN